MDPVEITAGRLHLRPWQPADVPALVAAGRDAAMARWSSIALPYDDAAARAEVTASAQGWADSTRARFAVLDAVGGGALGDVQLGRIAHGSAEIGYWTMPSARGTGVTVEAVGVICRWGFAELGLHRITAMVEVGNLASLLVAQKAGLRYEGVRRAEIPRRDGTRADAWCASLLAIDEVVDQRPFAAWRDGCSDGVVTLRHWVSSDAPDVARACEDSSTAQWLAFPSPYTDADGAYFTDVIAQQEWADGSRISVAVVDATSGELHGSVGVAVHPHGVGEVGYWTAPWARGRSVAARAARLIGDWAVPALHLGRVELLTDVDNTASARAAAKAGFVMEGVRRRARPAPGTDGRRDMTVWVLPGPQARDNPVRADGPSAGRAAAGP